MEACSMQLYLVENVAFSEENQNWILEEIQKAIYPNGFRRVADRLRYWGLLAACIGAFFTLIAIAVSLGIYVASTMNRESEFRGATTEQFKSVNLRLSDIENTLKFLRVQTVAQKYSTIPIPELKKHRDELATARKTLSGIPQDTPNYWPASFEIITLLSQAQFQLETIGQQPLSVMSNVRMINMPALGFVVREKNVLLKNLIEGIHFENSVIHFDASVRLVDDTFLNCVFILPPQENPPKSFQEIGRTLLTSDLSNVTLNAS